MEKDLENLAKSYAIGTYTSNGENEDDYDKFVALSDLDDSDFKIWEPFEKYHLYEIQTLVTQEYTTSLSLIHRALKLYGVL